MKIETKLNIGDKVYLQGVTEHLGHIEAQVLQIVISADTITYLWKQTVEENGDMKLWDEGEFTELDIDKTVWLSLAEWIKANEQELVELGVIDESEEKK